jgi:hypothetical protein
LNAKHWVRVMALGAVCHSMILSLEALASETNAIESLRFDPAEVHFGDISKIELIPSEKLGQMPIPILDDSGNGFVKILLPDGSAAWINRSDVQIGGVEVKAICAKTKIYSQASDKRAAHLRGISRNCN